MGAQHIGCCCLAETVPHQPSPSTSLWYRCISGTTTNPKLGSVVRSLSWLGIPDGMEQWGRHGGKFPCQHMLLVLPADHPRAREGLLIQQFGSCQGDGLLPLQEWQRPCWPTSTHCFCYGQVSEQWIITSRYMRCLAGSHVGTCTQPP